MKRYPLKYKVETSKEGFTKEELRKGDFGGCDSLVCISLIYPPDESLSAMVYSVNGQTSGKCDANEIYKAWLMLGQHLSQDEDLSSFEREVCKAPLEIIHSAHKFNKDYQ